MSDGRCSKKYPKALLEQTISGQNGYPLYRRTSPEQRLNYVVKKSSWTIDGLCRSHRFYRELSKPTLMLSCNSVESIKYICKYFNKGRDQGIKINSARHEDTRLQSGPYIGKSIRGSLAYLKLSHTRTFQELRKVDGIEYPISSRWQGTPFT